MAGSSARPLGTKLGGSVGTLMAGSSARPLGSKLGGSVGTLMAGSSARPWEPSWVGRWAP
eukprot:2586-Chlamydomonas_euryale.AAC.1